jgi:hypothetical protein
VSPRREIPTRLFVFALVALFGLAATVILAAARERSALPKAATRLQAASLTASQLTVCLQGVQDELFIPGAPRLTGPVHTRAALTRLRSCDVAPLARQLEAVDLPPTPPLIDNRRRHARAQIAGGLAALQRAVLDVRGADRAMAEDIGSGRNGGSVVLAYRSVQLNSDAADAAAQKALRLLGKPVPGG